MLVSRQNYLGLLGPHQCASRDSNVEPIFPVTLPFWKVLHPSSDPCARGCGVQRGPVQGHEQPGLYGLERARLQFVPHPLLMEIFTMINFWSLHDTPPSIGERQALFHRQPSKHHNRLPLRYLKWQVIH